MVGKFAVLFRCTVFNHRKKLVCHLSNTLYTSITQEDQFINPFKSVEGKFT